MSSARGGTILSAIAAAEPPDEPRGVCAGRRGLAILPGVDQASSVVTVFPMTTAAAARAGVMQAASAVGRCRTWIAERHSAGCLHIAAYMSEFFTA